MEVIEGKQTDKKVIIAQEIAFAKVLAGNNKTYRDKAVKKLSKWFTARGNGKLAFTEMDFLRIWTGLFYCMWMSDKFLVQEELAENISHLIHCFKKNSDNALLFIKCFNKRVLMEWEGLDQYRIDKFQMLVRRFLRQTFEYCRRRNWDETILKKLMDIFSNVVLHTSSSLGFVFHFINIYPEELAKVSRGKLENKTVLTLIEPFIKLLATTKDERILEECYEFFIHLMNQTDAGIDFQEQFNAWKQQGFPGSGPHCMKKSEIPEEEGSLEENDESVNSDEDDDFYLSKPLDPRAGSVNVVLPQIPLDIDGIINLMEKYEKSKQTNLKGLKKLKILIKKFNVLKKGKYPEEIKKDPILDEKVKKRRNTVKKAKELLEFTTELENAPIRTAEFLEISKQLELEESDADDNDDDPKEERKLNGSIGIASETEDEEDEVPQKVKVKQGKKNKNKDLKMDKTKTKENVKKKEKLRKKVKKKNKIKNGVINKEEGAENANTDVKTKSVKSKKLKTLKSNSKGEVKSEEVVKPVKKCENSILKNSVEKKFNGSFIVEDVKEDTPVKKVGVKRKILSNWQVHDLDPNDPEYSKIETPKIIRLERKIEKSSDSEENHEPEKKICENKNEVKKVESPKEQIIPVFWEKAKSKLNQNRNSKGNKMLLNPFAELNGETKSPSLRRISFALERNMAQENEEYLEEVRNSPKVPFDGSKRPVQSALKSGLAPSPVNPFYRFKKIKF